MTTGEQLSWDQFAAAIAGAAKLAAADLRQESRLLEDLGLDSLALLEVIVVLVVDCDMQTLADDLAERDWRRVTVGELYREYRDGEAPPRREEFTSRARPQT